MVVTNLIAYLIAIAIPAFSIYMIFALDLFGTGRKSTIYACLVWGAVGAFWLAYFINTGVNNALSDLVGSQRSYRTVVTVTAPIVEEILKSLILIYFIRQPSFRYAVDGAIYGFAVGIGFAVVENVFYLSSTPDAALSLAVSRVLSTSLMHATASAMVGISLGQLRRVRGVRTISLQLFGIAIAILIHIGYNNLVTRLDGMTLLLVAVGIGIGGSLMIGFLIMQGLADEKKRFSQTLGADVGVSVAERKAIQRLGGSSIENIMQELGGKFGDENVEKIRRLLVLQANIGILQNNLKGTVSDRLRQAWEDEVETLRAEFEEIRKELGLYVTSYLRNVFPTDDQALWDTIVDEMGQYDPTLVHTFDTFMRLSQLAETFTPEQMAEMAEDLHKISIFKYVSMADLENLSRAISVQTFEDQQMLFDQGDEGDAMYLIKEGYINIFTKDAENREEHLRTFKPGDVVGDFAVLDGQPRSARARAHGQLTAMILRRHTFMMFIQSRPQVILALLQVLAEKARYTTDALQDSIEWASNLARGNLDQIARQPLYANVASMPAPIPAPFSPPPEEEVTELSFFRSSTFLGGIYTKISSAITRRDPSLKQTRPRPTSIE